MKLIPKVKLKLGQRLPIHSKVNSGKWFIFKNENNIYSILLTFPQSDENLIERFLLKTRNTLKEIENLKKNNIDFDEYLNRKIMKYGIHHLRDISCFNEIGKLTFNENLFDSKKNEFEDESTSSFSNNQVINETQTLSELEKNFNHNSPKIKKMADPIPIIEQEEENKINENNDFFDFKMEKSNSPFPTKTELKTADICIKLENRFKDVSDSNKKEIKTKTKDSGKKNNIKIARYALLTFFILMFLVIIKMFIGLNNSQIMMVNNSVKHSSNKKSHSKYIL